MRTPDFPEMSRGTDRNNFYLNCIGARGISGCLTPEKPGEKAQHGKECRRRDEGGVCGTGKPEEALPARLMRLGCV